MGAIKDLVIGVMGFTERLDNIYKKKLEKYKKEMAYLRTEKFLNKFKKNYEESLLPLINSYISYEEKIEFDGFNEQQIVSIIMDHNNWNDIRNL